MTTASKAEEYVLKEAERRYGKVFLRRSGEEHGFDLRDEQSSHFIEVKGTKRPDLAKVRFRTLTAREYAKARQSLSNGLKYELVIMTGVGTNREYLHWYDATEFVRLAVKGTHYTIPVAGLRRLREKLDDREDS